MNLFRSLEASASGMTAERLRLDLIANNIANANTTRTPEGGPFRRRVAVFAPQSANGAIDPLAVPGAGEAPGGGVRVAGIREDMSPPRLRYEPGHPDADARGYVSLPNVDVIKEMVDMIGASRAYEANVTALNAAKGMFLRALEIGRG